MRALSLSFAILALLILAYSGDANPPEYPIVYQDAGKASKFPDGCKRVITKVKCSYPRCQIKASLGDCVLIHKYLAPINRTHPPEDPNCRPEEKLCVNVTNNGNVTIYGTLGVLPTTVYVQLNYVRKNITFEFLAKDKSEADYPGDVNYPQYPIVNQDAGQASKFPEGCKRIIFGTEVTCKFGRCKAKASLGDCVLIHQYIAPINRTYPPEDPNCRPEEKLCVNVTNNDNITIYGTLGVLPTTVYVQLNDLSRNITFEFLAKDKSEADYPGDVNYPQYPIVNQDAVQASKFPEGCKRIIFGTEVTCKFGRCKAKASLGDCVLVHQYIAPINRTYPPEDPNCRPEQTLCVNVTNNDNITIYGTLGVLPTTVYVQLNDLSRNITFEFLVQDMIATENLPTTTRVSAASSLSGVGSPTSTDAKADSVSNGTTQLQGEGGKTTSVSAATDGVTVLTFALLVLSALLK